MTGKPEGATNVNRPETAAASAGPRPAGGEGPAGPPPAPRMPAVAGVAERSAPQLARFHLAPDKAPGGGDGLALTPAALLAARGDRRLWDSFPMLLPEGGAARPLAAVVTETLDELAGAGQDLPLVRENVARLCRAAAQVAERGGGAVPAAPALADALGAFRAEFDLSDAGREALSEQIARLDQKLPAAGLLVSLDEWSAARLLAHAAVTARRERKAPLLAEMKRLAERVAAILRRDDELDPDRAAPEQVAAGLGDVAGRFVDPEKLAGTVPRKGPQRLTATRRARLERTLAELRERIEADAREPDLLLLVESEPPASFGIPGVRAERVKDALDAVVARFDEQAERLTETVRALRAARLEVEGAFEEDLHAPLLEALDWREATAAEQALVPRLAAVLPARALEEERTGAFVALLRSARPVVLLAQTPPVSVTEEGPALAGPVAGWLALAHRAAFALQGTLANPARLAEDLGRLALSPRTAVALCAVPPRASRTAWWRLVAADEGRALPAFCYDPEAGRHWADRFDVSGNRQPEAPWPAHALALSGDEQPRAERMTFAHAAALEPELRRHFRLIGPGEWAEDQVEIAELLDDPEARPQALPFVWVVRDDGELARALVSRRIAEACAERLDTWHALQEMGGLANEHARRAAAAAREQALAEAAEERRRMEAEHAEELQRVRQEATEQAVDRLVAVLTGAGNAADLLAAAPPAAAPPASGAATAAEPEAPAQEPAAEAEEEEEEEVAEEPYVDSVLCTSCNECINLNSRLFSYNADKQAQIADPSAGTFEQLVLAAEKCPARCIHPGAPRPGDATATDEMVKRAAKFN